MAVLRLINLGPGNNSFYDTFWTTAWKASVDQSDCLMNIYVHADFWELQGDITTNSTTQLLADQKVADFGAVGIKVTSEVRFICDGSNNTELINMTTWNPLYMTTGFADNSLWVVGEQNYTDGNHSNVSTNHRYYFSFRQYFLER